MILERSFTSLVSVALLLSGVIAFTIEDMKRLISDKKNDYNKKLRPVFHQNQTINIVLQLELVTIQEFDEVSGKFAVGAILIISWQDELIKWDPAEYGGMEVFPAETGDFWRPPIVLVNPYESLTNIGTDWDIVRYTAGGDVYVSYGTILEVSCAADVSYYPWDEHSCSMVFNSWGFFENEVRLTVSKDEIGTSTFQKNGLWDIVDTHAFSATDQEYTSAAVFSITIKRQPRFILVNIILPVVIMSFLNMLVFWIPTESGERISFCLTVLLSLAVFLTLVGDNLPQTSNPMSYLSYYLLAMLVISVCIVLATSLSLRFYFGDDSTPVPAYLSAIVRCFNCRCQQKRNGKRRQSSIKHVERSSEARMGKSDRHAPRDDNHTKLQVSRNLPISYLYHENWDLKRSYSGIIPNDASRHHKKQRKKNAWTEEGVGNDITKVTWKDVSKTVDVLFFFLFVIVLITCTIIFFVVIQNASQ